MWDIPRSQTYSLYLCLPLYPYTENRELILKQASPKAVWNGPQWCKKQIKIILYRPRYSESRLYHPNYSESHLRSLGSGGAWIRGAATARRCFCRHFPSLVGWGCRNFFASDCTIPDPRILGRAPAAGAQPSIGEAAARRRVGAGAWDEASVYRELS